AENQNVDVQYNFNDYLPKYEKFVICEDEETGTIYLNEKNFPYQTGDSVWLKKQRSLQTSWTGIQFNVGLEIRIWKNLRLGADYYRSRKLHVNVSENTEDMYFKEVKYLGYYSTADESLISCPPKYHRYCLELNRRALERQTEYTIMSQEIHLLLRYYLNIGRFSLAPSFGIADQQFLIKTTNNTVSTVLYPWKDKVISQTERTEYKTEKDNYQVALTGKFAVEYKLLSPSVRIAAEVSYQKFPEQKLIHESTISPNLNFDFGSKPLRGSVALKIAF
ncbi:MAG: hypothetical protein Q8N59_01185, partial [bacterium]|nr:hypothetical protein [bacterium]